MQRGHFFTVLFPELNHVLGVHLVVLLGYTCRSHFPVLEPVQVLQVSCTVVFSWCVTSFLINRAFFSVCSVPLVSELIETCIDDVLKVSGTPAVLAADEAGPSSSYAAPSATGEDSLNLSGEVTLSSHSRKSWLSASFEKSFSTHWKVTVTNVLSL